MEITPKIFYIDEECLDPDFKKLTGKSKTQTQNMIDLESLSYQQKLDEIKNEVDKSVLDPYFHSSLIENANKIKFRIKERAFKA